MAHKTNSFERFWKELKRRKVVHVITVYAATAFIILELVNMVARPLQLPDWTEAFVIVLLCIGFVISVFVSWIYDITPAGVKKTKPVGAFKQTDHTTAIISNGWKIATYVSGVIIIVLVVFNIIGRRSPGADISKLEKSIAVLPFRNDSPNDTNTYFINGIMEKVLNNLQVVKELRVISRTSVEQYRNTTKSIPEIAKEQGVNFIVEGSGQKYGNTFSVSIQLIKAAKENHLWGKSYEQEIRETRDITSVQSKIAQSIAEELKATITPEEKQLIEKTPTTIFNAYNLFLQARNEHLKFWMDNSNTDGLNKAISLYRQALRNDSTYAQGFSGLALGFLDKYNTQADPNTNYVDSMIIYANKALIYNDRLDEAFYVKGNYYDITGDYDSAIKMYSEAIKFNPNYSQAYLSRSYLHFMKTFEIYNAFNDYFTAIQLEHGPFRSGMMRNLGGLFRNFGFPENARFYFEEALKLDNDSISYLNSLAFIEGYLNDSRSLELSSKVLRHDASNLDALWNSLYCYERLGMYEEAYHAALNILQIWKDRQYALQYGWDYIGYAFWKTGRIKEAKYYFNKQISLGEKILKLDPNDDQGKLVLARVYAVLGEKEKALEFLNAVNSLIYVRYNKGNISSVVYLYFLKYDPLLENLRSESTFQKMVSDYENIYNLTYERFKTWLEEQGML
jgi:TolB-like protein